MRKRGGNFLKKAMAVLLSVVLCVGLVVGAEPVKMEAADGEQTVITNVTVLGYDGDDVNALGTVVLKEEYGSREWIPSASIKDGVITYIVTGLQANTKYYWALYSGTSHSVTSHFGTGSSGITRTASKFITIWFKDGDSVWDTDYLWEANNGVSIPKKTPVKEGYTFAGWVTENGGNQKYDFSKRVSAATSIYASWTREPLELTQNTLSNTLSDVIRKMPLTNDTSREEFADYIKKEMDECFQAKTTINVKKFNRLQDASSISAGALEYEVTADCGGFSARTTGIRPITKLPEAEKTGWTLDDAGNLVITNQEGMNEWTQSGRLEDGNVSNVKNVIIDDGVTEIPDNAFSGCGNLETITIPDSVTKIGDSAFAGSSSLGEVTLPPALNSIGNGAFSGCSSLEKVVMQGETPPTIGDSVFDGCKFVEEPENTEGIVVPSGSGDAYRGSAGGGFGEYIKEQAPEFTQEALDKKLKEILDNLPASNDITMDDVVDDVKKAIDEYFQIDSTVQPGMLGITKATSKEEGLIILDVTVSYGDVSVKKEVSKTIPKLSVEPDRGWTLDGDGNLTITSQEGMNDWTQSGRLDDGNVSNVKNVTIDEGVTKIPNNAFNGCGNLETIIIPDSVTGIGGSAFADNVSLGSVTLPQSLLEIGDGAFSGCSALDRVVMRGTEPPAMGNDVFDRCKFIENNTEGIIVPEGSEEKYRAVWGDSLDEYITENPPAVTEGILSSKLQEVFDGLIVSNDTTETDVSDKIKTALEDYFQTPVTVQIAYFKPTEATADTEGALSLTIIAQCGECRVSTEGTIPIAKLPDRGWALDDAGKLTIRSQAGMDDWAQTGKNETDIRAIKNLIIQGDVAVIPDSAFMSCNNLEAVTIPETVTDIGNSAFAFVSSISSITLPQGLQRIGNEAFLGCDSLEKVVMQGTTPPSIGESVFERCKFSVGNANKGIVVPTESIDAYKEAWGELGRFITEKHAHNYTDAWVSDETSHWHECVSCDVPGNKAAHVWDGGRIITEPTATEAGSISYSCSVCMAGKVEAIPATGTPSTSGNGNQEGNTPSTSGNGNQGSGKPSASGNGNQGGGMPSASGNGNQGSDIPSASGNGNQGVDIPSVSGNGNQGSGIPSTPDNGTQGGGSNTPDKDKYQPPENNTSAEGNTSQSGSSNDTGNIFQNADTAVANTSWTPEPKTGDGISTMTYATIAMILGFTYLILLFSERHGMTEETRKELLSRLVVWSKNGGKLRRMLALAGIFLLTAYYHSIGKQVAEEKETGLTV